MKIESIQFDGEMAPLSPCSAVQHIPWATTGCPTGLWDAGGPRSTVTPTQETKCWLLQPNDWSDHRMVIGRKWLRDHTKWCLIPIYSNIFQNQPITKSPKTGPNTGPNTARHDLTLQGGHPAALLGEVASAHVVESGLAMVAPRQLSSCDEQLSSGQGSIDGSMQ